MTIALTGSGGYFTRLGHMIGPASDLLAIMGGATTANIASGVEFPGRFSTLNADFVNGTPLPKTMAKSTDIPYVSLAAFQAAQAPFFTWLNTLSQDALGAMVNLDQGVAEDTAVASAAALKYLLNQMYGVGGVASPTATLQQSTVSLGAQTNVNTPAGNPVVVLGNKNVQGQVLQLVFPETITFTTTRDSQTGATPGNEVLAYAGYPTVSNPFSQLYPGGSGAAGNIALTDGSKSASAGNLLQNSDFTTFTTANVPDNWTIAVGTAGVQVVNGGFAHAYSPTVNGVLGGSVGFVGDSATLTKITQSFNTAPLATVGAGGTSVALTPDTQYAVNFWIIVPAGVPTAGVLRCSLQDGAGNILNDAVGTANSFSINLNTSAVGNAFVNVNGRFRTPANLTTQTTPFKIVQDFTTALTTGFTAYVGRLATAQMAPLYQGGPYCAAFSGNLRVIAGRAPDAWTFAVTNTYGKFQQWLDRVFNLRAQGLQFPFSGSPTVSDGLIL
jgi:hypothetical protein